MNNEQLAVQTLRSKDNLIKSLNLQLQQVHNEAIDECTNKISAHSKSFRSNIQLNSLLTALTLLKTS